MTIYDVELSFNVSVNVTPLTLYSELTQTFTHVRQIAVPFVTSSAGVNTWADYTTTIAPILNSIIIPASPGEDSIYKASVFDPEAAADMTFTEFTTNDLEEDMYEPGSWTSAVGVAKGFVDDSLSADIFTSEDYNKFKAGFDITEGMTKNDGFGYVGTRVVATNSTNDELDLVDVPRKLAIIFYQDSAIGAADPVVY